jgi:hypothetical protein
MTKPANTATTVLIVVCWLMKRARIFVGTVLATQVLKSGEIT